MIGFMKVIPIVPVQSTEEGTGDGQEEGSSLYASAKKIYPRKVTGVFAQWRRGIVWLTQVNFYGQPWQQRGDRPAGLFDLAARRFYFFIFVLYPQDLFYLSVALVISALALILFTAFAGRLLCGFAGPQT